MKTRFIKSVTQGAKTSKVEMPWARGRRRAEMIARRETAQPLRKSA